MRDVDVFIKLLQLERPWTVERVSLDTKAKTISVLLRHRCHARFHCPECGAVVPVYDHVSLRQWRHLDHGSWMT